MSAFRRTLVLTAATLGACSDGPTQVEDSHSELPQVVSIAPNPVSIQVGETIALRANGLGPGIIIIWTSSDPSVADVAVGGFLRGIKAGSTTIVAQAGTRSATALVTVGQRQTDGEGPRRRRPQPN